MRLVSARRTRSRDGGPSALPAYRFHLHLRRGLPTRGQGRRPDPAGLQHRDHEPALGGNRQSCRAQSPRRPLGRSGRWAPVDPSCRAGKHHHHSAAAEMPRAQPGRKRLAVPARQLALQSHLQIIRRSRRPLLCGLEPARRSAMAHHVPRIAPMGAPVLINGTRYKPGCTASEAIKIRSLTTGRARVGLAFDWLMPYVTAGAALVNVRDDLTVNVGGVSALFPPLSNTSLVWTAGAGVDVALSSNWSARLEYLHIRANGITSSVLIPGFLGNGSAAETATYRDNIVRIGLNYRIGPRGGPGVLETRVLPGSAYALNYDFLPSIAIPSDKAKSVTRPHDGTAVAQQPPEQAVAMPSDKAKSVMRPHDGTVVAEAVPQVAPQPSQAAQQALQQAAPIASEPKTSKRSAKNFLEIGDVDDLDGLSAEPEPPKLSSKKRREKEEDESQRLKRIMAICAGC